MNAVTRQEAIAQGLKYYTGRPCKKHGLSLRLLSSGTCSKCHNDVSSSWQKENPAASRAKQRKYRHAKLGIPAPTRPAPDNCENCGAMFCKHGEPNTDHDHVTGAFRGWLCSKCNRGLGMLDDSIAGLEQALRYLRRALQ